MDRVTGYRGRSSDNVAKFIVKNPFYRQEKEVEELLENVKYSTSTIPLYKLEYLIGTPKVQLDFDRNPDLKVNDFIAERFLRGGIYCVNLDISFKRPI